MDILRSHKGRDDAITSSEIADRLGIPEMNGNPITRREIREIMLQTGEAIGASSEGYFMIETQKELHDYVAYLESRISGIEDRITLVERCYDATEALHPEQIQLTEIQP